VEIAKHGFSTVRDPDAEGSLLPPARLLALEGWLEGQSFVARHTAQVQQQGRHRSPAQSRLEMWLGTGWNGPLSLLWFLLVISVFTVAGMVATSRGERVADSLAESSVRETADEVQVFLDYAAGRFGGWYEVDSVRVRLAGSSGWTVLQGVDAADASMIDVPAGEGWQQPTRATSYEPPLEVLVQRDQAGTVTRAMAAADFEYLRQHADRDKVVSALVVAGSLGGGVLVMLVHGVLLNRVRRRKAGS
jgi:hypothetical protein